MQRLAEFKSAFTENSNAQLIALKLRALIRTHLPNIEENIAGGSKVKLVLYSRGGANNVLCGLQSGAKDACYFYVHHLKELKHPKLSFSGKGKHAKRIAFYRTEEVLDEDIIWLLTEIEKNAPY